MGLMIEEFSDLPLICQASNLEAQTVSAWLGNFAKDLVRNKIRKCG